jgi:hypothetical protein
MMNCADKFLKHSERVGARFAEQNAGAQHRPVEIKRADVISAADAMSSAAAQK